MITQVFLLFFDMLIKYVLQNDHQIHFVLKFDLSCAVN